MTKHSRIWLTTILVAMMFHASAFAETKTDRIPYRMVEEWKIPNGGFGRTIVIDPKYRNEKDMRVLGETLKKDTARDRNSFIFIFDNERASKMRRSPPPENTKDGRFYDQHFIGDYTRNANTGFHSLGIMLKGVDGPRIEVKY